MGWAAKEFEGIDLGDKRLDRRAVFLAERLAGKPTASIPGACNGWAASATPKVTDSGLCATRCA